MDSNTQSYNGNTNKKADGRYTAVGNDYNHDSRKGVKNTESYTGGSSQSKQTEQDEETDSSNSDSDQVEYKLEDASVLLPSWKLLCRKIEKITTRFFGAAQVREARRTCQMHQNRRRHPIAMTMNWAGMNTARSDRGSSLSSNKNQISTSMLLPVTNNQPRSRPHGQDSIHLDSSTVQKTTMRQLVSNDTLRSDSAIPEHEDDLGSLSDAQTPNVHLDVSADGNTLAQANAYSNTNNICIPHGFQLVRTMYHQNASLKSILFMAFGEAERFVSFDTQNAHLWRGRTHVLKVGVRQNKESLHTSVTGINHWVFIPKWRIIVISTLHLELKILDTGLKCWLRIPTPKPTISLEFVHKYDELIVGSVGSISIWQFQKNHGSTGPVMYFKEPRLVISDFQIDEWVAFTAVDTTRELLYAVYDSSFNIYNYKTGHRIETMRNVHENSISAVLFYEPQNYFITGSKDSTSKVWNQQNYLLYEFKEHTNTVTGLCRVFGVEKAEQPFIMSCSLDSTVRMWNLDTGCEVTKMQTQAGCLGMQWMQNGNFCTYSSDTISVWYMNRFYSTFTYVSNPVIRLARSEFASEPARIFAASTDGSISLVSPRTGERIIMAFPAMADTTLVDSKYDYAQECVYALSANGDITIYSSHTNPCSILDKWAYNGTQEKMTCLDSLFIKKSELVVENYRNKPISIILLLCGTENGQIVYRDVRRNGKQELLMQAHIAGIVSIHVDSPGSRIFTTSRDATIKIWSIEYLESSNANSTILENVWHKLFKGKVHVHIVHLASISAAATDGIFTKCCYAPSLRTFAVCTENHATRFFSIGLNNTINEMKHHPSDEDHISDITDISKLETPNFCIFATAGQDGTVKIWDGMDNCLIREMQFPGTAWSICFANPRGDLLVGLSDQIALVQVHEYLSTKNLLKLLEQDWSDDIIEKSVAFDDNLDFWKHNWKQDADGKQTSSMWDFDESTDSTTSEEDELERRRREYISNSENLNLLRLNELMNPSELQDPSTHGYVSSNVYVRTAADEISKRRFFDDDGEPSTIYNLPEMSFNALMRENARIELRIEENAKDIAEIIERNEPKLSVTVNVSSESLVHTPALNRDNKSKQKIIQNEFQLAILQAQKNSVEISKPQSLEMPRKNILDVLERARERKAKQDDDERERVKQIQEFLAVSSEPAPILSTPKRGWLLETMIRNGVAPNSVFAASADRIKQEALEQKQLKLDKQAKLIKLATVKQASRWGQYNDYFSPIELPKKENASPDYKPTENVLKPSNFTDNIPVKISLAPVTPVLKSKTPVKKTVSKPYKPKNAPVKYVAPKPFKRTSRLPIIVRPRIKASSPFSSNSTLSTHEESIIESMTEEDLILSSLGSVDMFESEAKVEDNVIQVATVTVTVVDEKTQPSELQETANILDKVVAVCNIQEKIEAPSTPIAQSFQQYTPNMNQSKMVEECFLNQHQPEESQIPSLPNSAVTPTFSKSIENVKPNYLSVVNSEKFEYNWQPIVHEEVSNEIINKLSWDLFKTAQVLTTKDTDYTRLLDRFKSTDWFRGIGSAQINITSIVNSLFESLREGEITEKVQAAKGLMYMYHTFKADFKDPINQIVNPQLQQMHDPNWQVRTQIINNLASYQIFNENIVYAMIVALADPSPQVVESAINTLSSFGISSTYALQNVMMHFQMIPTTVKECKNYSNTFEKLAAEYQFTRQHTVSHSNSDIIKWLGEIDKRVYGHTFARPDSSIITLCARAAKYTSSKSHSTRSLKQNTKASSLPPIPTQSNTTISIVKRKILPVKERTASKQSRLFSHLK
ncbi:hypothetical protein QVD99_000798 [Batrachochytrium dendrobatidis]|nr:hypothetical protein QVD99_000798 [Batrachochytrium dendrobatidis]